MGFWSQLLGVEETETIEAGLDEAEEDLSDQATYFEPPEGFVYDPASGGWVAEEEFYADGNSGGFEPGFYDDNYEYDTEDD